MKQETTHLYLHKRLSEMSGLQSLIARETNISQASISRIARGEQIPSVLFAEQLMTWLKRYDRLSKRLQKTNFQREEMRI